MQDHGSRSALRGWLLRVGWVYWLLYCVRVLAQRIDPLLNWLGPAVMSLFMKLDVWVGYHVLGIAGPMRTDVNGSGDRMVDWIHLLDLAVIAIVVGSLWAVLDRRRAHDARLREGLRILLRYTLGFGMLVYGLSKLLALQFPVPNEAQLLQRWGDSSPMNVLWTFMGTSPAYEIFTGAAETIGALLVLFRRTTLIGALLLATVMVNVVMLNFCYDVCVKLFSSHLLVMSLALIAAEADRLIDVLVHGRATAAPAAPPSPPAVLARRGWRRARWAVKYVVIAIVLVSNGWREVAAFTAGTDSPWQTHWTAGYWRVTAFARDGHDVPADEATRWERVRFQPYDEKLYVRWRMHEKYGPLYRVTVDEAQHVLDLAGDPERGEALGAPVRLQFVRDANTPTHLVVRGQVDGHAVEVQLDKAVVSDMLLRTRGFHWISEVPFNR